MSQHTLGLDTYQLSTSYDASTSGTAPSGTNATAYTMAGEPETAVTLTYRSVLQQIFSLSQDPTSSAADKAKNAVKLLQIVSQLRQSAVTGFDYVNGFGTEPFIMSDSMVQSLDVLASQMASNGLTPAKMIAWANSTSLTSIVPIPTDYLGIQNSLNIIRTNLTPLTTIPTTTSTTVSIPDATFDAWQQGIVASDNKTLLLTQIQSTFPTLSTPLDSGDGTGSATQVLYHVIDIDPQVVSTYNELITSLNVIAGKQAADITTNDANQVVAIMKLLRQLANGTQVLDVHTGAYRTARLTSEMVRAMDTISRSLSAVGLNTSLNAPTLPSPSTAAVAAIQAWVAPSTTDGQQSLAQIGITSAKSAGAITGSEQALVELQYVTAGIDMLEKQLTGLNQALSAVQTTAQLLGTLQQIHNYIDVNAPVPLALQAYNYLANDTKMNEYVGLVQKAIFNQMSGYEKTLIANEYGLDPASFAPSDINAIMLNGIAPQVDGSGALVPSTGLIKGYFSAYKTIYTNNISSTTLTDAQQVPAIFNAAKNLIDQLARLAYVTLPRANLDASNNPLAAPVVPPSQINALRALINPFLKNDLYNIPANLGNGYSPPSGLTQPYTYILGAKPETTAPTTSYTAASPLPTDGSVDSKFNIIDNLLSTLRINTSLLFTLNPAQSNAVTTSGQTTATKSQSVLPNPASYGIIGNLEWNATDTDLGAAINSGAQQVNIGPTIGAINTIFSNAAGYGVSSLKTNLNTMVDNLASQGALTIDQQLALKSTINNYLSPQEYLNRPFSGTVGGSTFTGPLNAIINDLLYDNINSYTTDVTLRGQLSALVDTFKENWISVSLDLPTPPDAASLARLKDTITNFTFSMDAFIESKNLAPNVTFNLNLDTFSKIKDLVSSMVIQPPYCDATSISNNLQAFLTRRYSETPNDALGILGLFSRRMNITPSGESQSITPDALTALGIPNTPDFNLQSAIIKAYNQLSSDQRKAFVATLGGTSFTYVGFAAAASFLAGPEKKYQNIAFPTVDTIASGAYVPIPADKFAAYYLTIYPSTSTPILNKADMVEPNLSVTKFEELAKKIYSMTIPPFVKLPAGQSIDDVLASILNVRAQLAQQLAGLTLAEQQQQSANGSTASVTPIVKYVTAVLKDLERIPDPTASTYNAADARSALNSWILDGLQLNGNSTDSAVQAAAANAGTIQTNLQTAITSATNMNGTQQQKFQQYMTVYSEFMQSASAVLTALMQIIRAMITGMK